MRAAVGNDRWTGSFRVDAPGRWEFTRPGVGRPFRVVPRRAPAQGGGRPDRPRRASSQEGAVLFGVAELDVETALASTEADRFEATRLVRPLGVDVDRERARFGAWYELFPRSWGGFAGVEKALPELARARLRRRLPAADPPDRRHEPQGAATTRSRPGRTTPAAPGRSGARRAVTPASIPGSGRSRTSTGSSPPAGTHGVEIALDFAIQCSPDHPWLKEHPEWFHRRPDGTLKYAENPPKRYQDIYNVNFDSADWQGLWAALRDVVLHWVAHGVQVFRVDNPHTKPLPFWEWLIGEVRAVDPDVVFLVRGVHAAGDDGRAREGGLQPVLHVLHLEEHEGGADRVHDRADALRAAAVLPAELLREHAGHPPRVPAARRPAGVRGATRARGDAVAELRDLLRLRARRERPGRGRAARSTSTRRSTRSSGGRWTARCCRSSGS